jgi:hypothetical protein
MTMTKIVCFRCHGGPADGRFVAPLHGDKGGPLMCVPCRLEWDRGYVKDLKRCPDWKLWAHGLTDSIVPGGDLEVTYLTLELLMDVLALTHPDLDPPERQEKAKRVTAELLELKPYTLPRPKREPAPPATPSIADTGDRKPFRMTYPCTTCFLTTPAFYCGACRDRYEEIERKHRDYKNRRQRERYARRRKRRAAAKDCAGCGAPFTSKRRDARYCSVACRQRAHRGCVTDTQTLSAARSKSRDSRPP